MQGLPWSREGVRVWGWGGYIELTWSRGGHRRRGEGGYIEQGDDSRGSYL